MRRLDSAFHWLTCSTRTSHGICGLARLGTNIHISSDKLTHPMKSSKALNNHAKMNPQVTSQLCIAFSSAFKFQNCNPVRGEVTDAFGKKFLFIEHFFGIISYRRWLKMFTHLHYAQDWLRIHGYATYDTK